MKEWIVTEETLVEETTVLTSLIIRAGGKLVAPKGKFVHISENGAGRDPAKPGTYYGDIVVTVAETYPMCPHGLMKMNNRRQQFRDALVIRDNEIVESQSVPAAIHGGTVTGSCADGITIKSDEPGFNGILVTGDSHYTVRNATLRLDGQGFDDFAGVGAGVAAIDNAHVTIEDSDIQMSGETRCAIHVGGDSVVHVNRCRIENHSPENEAWMGNFSWGFAALGTNRLVQLCDNGTVYYNDCDLRSNGWGIFSIDGCDDSVRIYAKDCRVDLSGSHSYGYGGFCIGDRNVVSFDHCDMKISAYPVMVRGMLRAARVDIVNGCNVRSEKYGVLCYGDIDTPVRISDSTVCTESSTLVVKGSSTKFYLSNAQVVPGNGVVLQLMDNDECGMDAAVSVLPIGRTDTYVEGRDLAAFDPEFDVLVQLKDMNVTGNFYNSTTELHMERDAVRVDPSESFAESFGGLMKMPEDLPAPPPGEELRDEFGYDALQRGAKNAVIEMVNARVEGVISSASFAYREGLTRITADNRKELSNITQTAAPTINNGVIVRMDKDSTWYVTGTSYLTSLELERTSLIFGTQGRKVRMTVDGVETPIAPGKYVGKIVLELV
jgi:hypothetical protein